ncbi:unnamed protein product [Parascedosporium putredinis]|uniref:Superoxide dismutase copper/zinc binding domain-containing protein n=1 Tax=Parascedosporium putredinis TaxID=1442378 RepID=A0A9P1H237_9PEZI|nr:unnamed protein product [Parascedosporium putredinis]CAI7994245.1 unnamed protein product [Parascedosporium putredinis]
MRNFEVAVILAAAGALAQTVGTEHNAVIVSDSPVGAKYIANFEGIITGRVLAGSDAFGIGVTFHVALTGLSEADGPYKFHLHEFPVPASGDCAGTGGHLDPFGRTQEPACESDWPESCEVGDLSGKHGTVEGTSDEYSFHDLFTSLNPANDAFFGDKSIVLHNNNGDRVACASFAPVPKETTGEEPVEVIPELPAEEPEEETPAPETPPAEEDEECEAEPEEPPEEPVTETPPAEEDEECEAEPEEPAEGGHPEEPVEGEVTPEEPVEGEVTPEEPVDDPEIIVIGPIEGEEEEEEDGMRLGP